MITTDKRRKVTLWTELGVSFIAVLASMSIFARELLDVVNRSISMEIILSIGGVILGASLSVVFKYFITSKPRAKVYISYSAKDKPIVRKLYDDLRKSGIQAILDEDVVMVGDAIKERIAASIKGADVFILVLSKNSIETGFFREELSFALQNKKRVFPILIDDSIVPQELSSVRYADFRSEYGEAFELLLKSIKRRTDLT